MNKDILKEKSIIPKGVATLLPEQVIKRRNIEKEILDLFFNRGFQEIITPIFEYLDVISCGLEEDVREKSYKFVDRSSGRLMILRPDVTSQIARISATMLTNYPKPLRLCYNTNVFRHAEEHAGREREIFQLGAELIGSDSPEADAEMIMIAIESLNKLGLGDHKVAVGHVGIFRYLMEPYQLNKESEKIIKELIIKKDTDRLRAILKYISVPNREIESIIEVANLFGNHEDVFNRTEKVVKGRKGSQQSLNRLKDVYNILKDKGLSDNILIDIGELRGFDYYTGLVFDIYVKGLGYELGGGGRYDDLLQKFGYDLPATGFAFDIERIQLALEKSSINI